MSALLSVSEKPSTNYIATVVDNIWLLDTNEPSKKVVCFSQTRSTPKMWLSETKAGWYMAASGDNPLMNTHFKSFSIAMF